MKTSNALHSSGAESKKVDLLDCSQCMFGHIAMCYRISSLSIYDSEIKDVNFTFTVGFYNIANN